MRLRAFYSLVVCGAACQSAADPSGDVSLHVAPATVTCVAGDQVALTALLVDGPAVPIEFEAGGGVWLTSVQRSRGGATVACEAAGRHNVRVSAGNRIVDVPVTVEPPLAGTLQLAVSPSAITLVNGSVQLLTATIRSSRAGVSTAARFVGSDTAVIAVDSVAGTVRATGPGDATVVVRALADPATRAVVPVTVTRGSLAIVGLSTDPYSLLLQVGDSARLGATVFLAPGAPNSTSRVSTFTSSNTDVVRITAGNVAHAVGSGTTTIIVAPVAAPALKASVSVTVHEPVP